MTASEPGRCDEAGEVFGARAQDREPQARAARRRMRLATGLLASLALCLLGAEARRLAVPVFASEFVLRDPLGRTRAALAMHRDGMPGLALFDERGKVRMSFDLSPAGAPGVNL